MPKRFGNLPLVLFAIFAGLFACECFLRIYERYSPFALGVSQLEILAKDNRRWWGMATFQHTQNGEPPHYVLSSNSRLFYEPNTWFYGFKSRINASPGAYRIFVLGDSTTRLEPRADLDSDYYPYQLEALLNKDRSGEYIVVNCGIPGYATTQEVEFLEKKLLPFKPDLVVVGYCLNDRDIKHRIIRKQGYYACADLSRSVPVCPGVPFSVWLYMNSELYKLVNHSLVKACKILKIPASYVDLGDGVTIQALQRLKQLSQAHNFKAVFVVFPSLEYWESSQKEQAWISTQLKSIGFEFIDMKKAFDDYGMNSLKLALGDRYHFNAAGHALVAKELYDYLSGGVLNN